MNKKELFLIIIGILIFNLKFLFELVGIENWLNNK